MKGVFFDQPFEITLEVEGSEFVQGAAIPCRLSVKNRSNDAAMKIEPRLDLAIAEIKKVQQKSADAFCVVATAECEINGSTTPGETTTLSWTFPLSIDTHITDKSKSLYLLYGARGNSGPCGQLQLTVKPHPHVKAILDILETSFQFVLRGVKSDRQGITAKFKPSSAKRFSRVEELVLTLKFEKDLLRLKYGFKVKKLHADPTSLTVSKDKSSVEQQITTSEFVSEGYINQHTVEQRIEEALQTVASSHF